MLITRCLKKSRSSRGQSIVEAAVAAIVLVPIVLVLFNFLVILIGNSMNDTACKNAARAAANQNDGPPALAAVKSALASVHPSPFVHKIEFIDMQYNKNDSVGVHTRVTIGLPIPFPGWSVVVSDAQDIEPIVGAKSPNEQ